MICYVELKKSSDDYTAERIFSDRFICAILDGYHTFYVDVSFFLGSVAVNALVKLQETYRFIKIITESKKRYYYYKNSKLMIVHDDNIDNYPNNKRIINLKGYLC